MKDAVKRLWRKVYKSGAEEMAEVAHAAAHTLLPVVLRKAYGEERCHELR